MTPAIRAQQTTSSQAIGSALRGIALERCCRRESDEPVIRLATDDGGGTLKVAGDLTGEWSAFLERECVLPGAAQTKLTLDLSDLRRVDCEGVEALRRLKERGARITHCPPMIADLIG